MKHSRLVEIAARVEEFEAPPSVRKTGTGSRPEGGQFEDLVREFWGGFQAELVGAGAQMQGVVRGRGQSSWITLRVAERRLYLPTSIDRNAPAADQRPAQWFTTDFLVSDLVDSFPGRPEAIKRYAPSVGPFSGASYPHMYAALTTCFDDTIVLEDKGVMSHKILFEYKSAKSSDKRRVDGNAHERLSFQALQYLEIATRYTNCSFVVVANGAWIRYRNKYHVAFHVQADRLANFAWFRMSHLCSAPEYLRIADGLRGWMLDGRTFDPGGAA